MKTNAVRLLEAQNIPFELRQYEIGEAHFSAEKVAELVGLPPERVFKTLITLGDRSGPLLVLMPAGTDLDLRLLAKASNNKKVEMAPLKEVLALTGYERGAVSPLGTRRKYPTYIEETVELWDSVAFSAGVKGLQIVMGPEDLIRVTQAQVAPLV